MRHRAILDWLVRVNKKFVTKLMSFSILVSKTLGSPARQIRVRHLLTQSLLIIGICHLPMLLRAAEPVKWDTLRPMLEERCYDCHGGIKTKGGVDMKKLDKNPSVAAEYD